MRSLMTHGLMSLFSVMGQKGKLPFRDHLLCKVVSSKYISIDLCALLYYHDLTISNSCLLITKKNLF